jgi:hypothetical protein
MLLQTPLPSPTAKSRKRRKTSSESLCEHQISGQQQIALSIIFADILILNCFHASSSSFSKRLIAFSSPSLFVSALFGIVYSSSESFSTRQTFLASSVRNRFTYINLIVYVAQKKVSRTMDNLLNVPNSTTFPHWN